MEHPPHGNRTGAGILFVLGCLALLVGVMLCAANLSPNQLNSTKLDSPFDVFFIPFLFFFVPMLFLSVSSRKLGLRLRLGKKSVIGVTLLGASFLFLASTMKTYNWFIVAD